MFVLVLWFASSVILLLLVVRKEIKKRKVSSIPVSSARPSNSLPSTVAGVASAGPKRAAKPVKEKSQDQGAERGGNKKFGDWCPIGCTAVEVDTG